jgi:hypothetical protein
MLVEVVCSYNNEHSLAGELDEAQHAGTLPKLGNGPTVEHVTQ